MEQSSRIALILLVLIWIPRVILFLALFQELGALAKNIVKKEVNLVALKWEELLEVSKFSKKIFEQSAGFLRIYAGKNPLDQTSIHPERYQILLDWCAKNGLQVSDLLENEENIKRVENSRDLRKILASLLTPIFVRHFEHLDKTQNEVWVFSYREDLTDINNIKLEWVLSRNSDKYYSVWCIRWFGW